MKKYIFALAALMTIGFSAKADHEQVITYNQLPAPAQALLKQYFADKVPLIVTMDWDDYTIMYESGEKVEFNKQGEWKEIDCKTSKVPVELIPEKIKKHIDANFPGTTIIDLDRDRRGYEVKLNNGLDIDYNRDFSVIGIDN